MDTSLAQRLDPEKSVSAFIKIVRKLVGHALIAAVFRRENGLASRVRVCIFSRISSASAFLPLVGEQFGLDHGIHEIVGLNDLRQIDPAEDMVEGDSGQAHDLSGYQPPFMIMVPMVRYAPE